MLAHDAGFWTLFYELEWITEWIAYGLSRWALVEILEYGGKFAVLVVVVLWFMESDDRRNERHNQAWTLLAIAADKAGDLGRLDSSYAE